MPENKLSNWIFGKAENGSAPIILLRLMAGGVFLWEGVLKFVYPNLGIGRFAKLGIPLPDIMAPFVAILEIVGGICLISGYLTRIFSILFVIEMTVAILSTKIPMLMGTYPLALAPSPPQSGIGLVLHEIRSDYAQIMTAIFLLIMGPGRLSLDAMIAKSVRQRSNPANISQSISIPVKERVSQGGRP